MSGSENNKALVQKAFDDWAAGSGTVFDLLADDVSWTITGSCPISGTYNGREEFLETVIGPLSARLSQPIVPVITELYAEGDMVVALWGGKAVAADGRPYENTYSWYMTFDGDRIIKAVAFFDGIALADLWERVPIH